MVFRVAVQRHVNPEVLDGLVGSDRCDLEPTGGAKIIDEELVAALLGGVEAFLCAAVV